jgi:mannose-6-phosphate isomerase-like protein (cupin superfamily)
MIIRKVEAAKSENSQSCVAYEYPFGDKEINVAFIEIDGRYPDAGCVTNTVVKELLFVVEGRGKVVIDGDEQPLEAQDAILIKPNQKYFFEGRLKLVSTCAPAWYPEQHRRC